MNLRRSPLPGVCVSSKALDGLGVRPDAGYAQLDQELRDALVVGRPIADA